MTVPSDTRASMATCATVLDPFTICPTTHSPMMCVRSRKDAVVTYQCVLPTPVVDRARLGTVDVESVAEEVPVAVVVHPEMSSGRSI